MFVSGSPQQRNNVSANEPHLLQEECTPAIRDQYRESDICVLEANGRNEEKEKELLTKKVADSRDLTRSGREESQGSQRRESSEEENNEYEVTAVVQLQRMESELMSLSNSSAATKIKDAGMESQLMSLSSSSAATEIKDAGVEHEPVLNDTKYGNYDTTAVAAVQCSPNIGEKTRILAIPANKSVQTDEIGLTDKQTDYKEKAIQATLVNDKEQINGQRGSLCTYSTQLSEAILHTGCQCSMKSVDDEVLALRNELSSAQNTVIWQSLMLRLYAMH